MSTSQTELRNTELQQQQSTGLTTAKQLIRRKGKITPLSTTPQSNTNDIARSSCIDLTSTPSARTTSEAKHQYPHNQIITTSTSECVNDTQPQSLSGTEERSSCSTSIPSSEMLSANTCIHVLPSPETARIRPSQHHQTHDTITPQHISTIDQSPNSRSSILSFLWTVSSRLNNNVKSDIRCNAFSPSLASIHQPHHQQFKSLNESSITGSTNSTTNCAPDDLQVTEASSISHLDAPIPFGALTFDISRTKDDNDDNGSDYQKSFCTSRQNSRTSVANSAALSTGEGLQKTSLLLADQSCEKRQKCRDSFGVDLNGDHQETASLRIDGDVQRSPSEQSTDVTQSEAGTASIDHHQHPVYTASALCQCPCRNCATCPLRATRGKREVRRRDVNKDFNNEDDKDELHEQKNPSFLMRIKTRMINFCMMEAEDNPARFKYDVSVIPKEPLPKGKQRLLEITELPFLILWVSWIKTKIRKNIMFDQSISILHIDYSISCSLTMQYLFRSILFIGRSLLL